MKEFQQKIEQYQTLKENASKYYEEKDDLRDKIYEIGAQLMLKELSNVIWCVDFFDGSLLRLKLMQGNEFARLSNELRELGYNYVNVNLVIDEYEFEVYNDSYSIRILDVFRKEKGEYVDCVRGVELMKVYSKYLKLDLDNVNEHFQKKIESINLQISSLKTRRFQLEHLRDCITGEEEE